MASIRVRNGKFLARVRIAGKPIVSHTFNDKHAAYAWAAQTEDEIRRGIFQFNAATIPSLRETIGTYLKSSAFKAKRGAATEKYFYDEIAALRVATQPMDQIGANTFTALRDTWMATLSASTVARRFTMLRALYSYAKEDRHLPIENTPAQVRLQEANDSRSRRPSAQEVDAICAATGSSVLASIVRLALETAMRRGEIVSLHIENISLATCTVLLPMTKNGHARTVPLTPKAKTILEAAIGERKHGRLFTEKAGSITQAWRRAVTRARRAYEAECVKQRMQADPTYLYNLRLHDTRHDAISKLIEGGFSTIEAAQASGHRTLSMLQRYVNLHPQHLVNKLAQMQTDTSQV